MPEVKYRDDNRSQTQKVPAKLGNEQTGGGTTKVYEKGSQAQKAAEPMKPSEDIWSSYPVTKRETI
jgi:hypothetical protein